MMWVFIFMSNIRTIFIIVICSALCACYEVEKFLYVEDKGSVVKYEGKEYDIKNDGTEGLSLEWEDLPYEDTVLSIEMSVNGDQIEFDVVSTEPYGYFTPEGVYHIDDRKVKPAKILGEVKASFGSNSRVSNKTIYKLPSNMKIEIDGNRRIKGIDELVTKALDNHAGTHHIEWIFKLDDTLLEVSTVFEVKTRKSWKWK